MNPQDHFGRTDSPFNDWLEGSGVVDDVDVINAPPVAAAAVAGVVHLPELANPVSLLMVAAVGSGLIVGALLAIASMVALGGS